MKQMKVIFTLLAVVLVAGCAKDPVAISSSTNPEVPIANLFTHEGCTVYRFVDDGWYHYFAKCVDSAETISQKTSTCGKNCFYTRDENIRTNK